MNKPARAAIYARKSTQQDVSDEQKSVTRQVENATAFAHARGWTVDEQFVFVDDGISGAETAKLESRQRMIRLALSGNAPFDVIVMQAPDRFSRQDGDEAFGELKQLARCVDLWFYSTSRQFEFGTFESNVTGVLQSEFAAEFRRNIASKTREAHRRHAERGYVTGGRTFGYDNVPIEGKSGKRDHVERRVNTAEADVVRRVFTLFASGLGLKAVARQLTREHVPAPRNNDNIDAGWSPSTIRSMLRRELYRGVCVYNKTKKRNARGEREHSRSKKARPESEWLRVERKEWRIVPEELWHQVLGGHPKPAINRHLKTGHFLMAVDRDVDRDAEPVLQRRYGERLGQRSATTSRRVGPPGVVAPSH